MQATVATLLLITASVVMTCVVIDYAICVIQTTLQTTDIPQLDRLKEIENTILNQTDALFNQTQPFPTAAAASPPLTIAP